MKKLWRFLTSIDLAVWLLGLICAAMAVGSFLLVGETAAAINALPLFVWLVEAQAGISWWLWLTIILLALLALNTLCCSWDTIRLKFRRAALVPLLAPQLIHAGFLLIMLAHLISALWGFKGSLQLAPGMQATLPDGRPFMLGNISATMSPRGMPIGFSGELFTDPANPTARVTISPNNPWLSRGYGVYIKHAESGPQPWALLEVHREPGAAMALAGSLLFSAGCIMLLWVRSKQREDR